MASKRNVDPSSLDSLQRTGEILNDQLALYEGGHYYDCTFQVAYQETTPKVFHCHKVILARASIVFAKMLYGDFSESSKDKDDPIKITNVEAHTFDLVMRYIYGGKTDFEDVATACKVYRISHHWLINSLMKVASEFLKYPSSEDAITVLDMYKACNDHSHSEKLLSIIALNASKVLKSAAWLKTSLSTILDILQLECLEVESETELFKALFAWGAADGVTGDNITDVDAIRAKTHDALKCIRFMTMKCEEFAELCTLDCAQLMTDNERFKVLLSINLADGSRLPQDFSKDRKCRNEFRTIGIGFEAIE
ncbi:BTB/POZ domain-containing protein 6-like [Neocloeon triangulifer]|uniref:BTB/POZ domain-containing protein 6-like n=1 Tax=Neocloeon triangulifer TaxID=2078957 RepID=UPI00286F5BF3|nr:BTB/POZ domain-containing protein 6-like [Neocloeon triangulifer]